MSAKNEPRGELPSGRDTRRLDQWLWFARFAKSRSIAARLCVAGEVTVNGIPVVKANHTVKPGDIVCLLLGSWQRTVEVLALGARRGPAIEARTLFRETAPAQRADRVWEPLLLADDD